MKLMVCSKSTEKYADKYPFDEKLIVTRPPDATMLEREASVDFAWAIGGGSVIDTAKIISSNVVVAIPTTYSGASQTSHAVYLDKGKKCSIKTEKPIVAVMPSYLDGLTGDAEVYSKIDCLCHIMESMVSKNITDESRYYANKAIELIHKGDWLFASIYAGDAIEITGTNVLHGLSYPLTAKYGIPHGEALATILHEALNLDKVKELL